MCKHLRIWPFVPIGSQLTSTSLLAEGVITMTTTKAIGEEICLGIEANGNVTIEGAQEAGQAGAYGSKYYTIKSQVVVIRGDVTELNCLWNQLTSLDVSKNTALEILFCSDNQLTSLDVSKNTALTSLSCSENQLTSLDVSKNTSLTDLECFNNQLTSLDLSQNTALTTLYCFDNQLTSLNVSRNRALTTLSCGGNQLTSLDVSKNTALEGLYCSENQLTSLNISGCARLEDLFCFSNCINGKAMTKLVNGLPDRKGMSSGSLWVVDRSSKKSDKNRCSAADVTTAKKKNWEVEKIRAF